MATFEPQATAEDHVGDGGPCRRRAACFLPHQGCAEAVGRSQQWRQEPARGPEWATVTGAKFSAGGMLGPQRLVERLYVT